MTMTGALSGCACLFHDCVVLFYIQTGYLVTSPWMFSVTNPPSALDSTVTVLLNVPTAAALNVALIVPDAPGIIGCLG